MDGRNRSAALSVMITRLLVAVAVVQLVALLILLGMWVMDRPAQAAASELQEPAQTADSVSPIAPVAHIDQPVASLPAATPLPPTPVAPPAEPAVVVEGSPRVNVRTGPSTEYARIGLLVPGSRVSVIGRNGDWWQVAYEGEPAWVYGGVVAAVDVDDVPEVEAPVLATPVPSSPDVIPAPAEPAQINETRWIDVDLSEQRLTAYEGQTPIRTTLVSSGLSGTPTPVGQFRIWIKLRYDDMAGADYYIEDVPFVMYFYRGYGLHGVTWHGNFGYPMSHGCVNLPTAEAEWLFTWAEVGTLVNVHD